MIGIGPKDKWEHDLEKMSRAALAELVKEMQFHGFCLLGLFDRDDMADRLTRCKRYGKWANEAAKHARFMADPNKAIYQAKRRSKAAKAAARRRKKEARQKKMLEVKH